MNEKPQFDPARSSAIKRMLMSTVEDATDAVRAPRKRVALVISLAAAALLLATGSAALALGVGGLIFPAPAPTPSHTETISPTPSVPPTNTPTPEVSPPANVGIPRPTVPVDCLELGPLPSITALVPNPAIGESDLGFTPEFAAVQQGGVLHCQWNGTSSRSFLIVDVAMNTAAGHADIASQKAAGAGSLNIDDASALSCQKITIGCSASVVSGAYWLNLEYQGPADSYSIAPAKMAQIVQDMAPVLREHPTPGPEWQGPQTSWEPSRGCASLSPATPMATILASPGMTGPSALKQGSMNGIDWTQAVMFNCRWSVADNAATLPKQARSLDVQLTPGARWAYEAVAAQAGTHVEVTGAQAAAFQCQLGDGGGCWLNVLVDDSWMQLGFSNGLGPEFQAKIIGAAEAIIAAHTH